MTAAVWSKAATAAAVWAEGVEAATMVVPAGFAAHVRSAVAVTADVGDVRGRRRRRRRRRKPAQVAQAARRRGRAGRPEVGWAGRSVVEVASGWRKGRWWEGWPRAKSKVETISMASSSTATAALEGEAGRVRVGATVCMRERGVPTGARVKTSARSVIEIL